MAPLGVKYPVRLFWRYITPLFTFGSIYSTRASGTEQTTETNVLNITLLRISTGRRQTSWGYLQMWPRI